MKLLRQLSNDGKWRGWGKPCDTSGCPGEWTVRGRQRKWWIDKVKEWMSLPMTELLMMEGDLCLMVPHVVPTTETVGGLTCPDLTFSYLT